MEPQLKKVSVVQKKKKKRESGLGDSSPLRTPPARRAPVIS